MTAPSGSRLDALRSALLRLRPGGKLSFKGGYAVRFALPHRAHERIKKNRMKIGRKVPSRFALYADGVPRAKHLLTCANANGAANAIIAFEDDDRTSHHRAPGSHESP